MNFPDRPGTALGTLGEPKNSLKLGELLRCDVEWCYMCGGVLWGGGVMWYGVVVA